MKTILILSDTHMPKRATNFPSKLLETLDSDIDLIIHAGDFQTKLVYERLKEYAPVLAVHGNVDDEELKDELPLKAMVVEEGVRICVTHGHGLRKTTEKRALALFKHDNPDVLIYGHSHIPVAKKIGDLVIFNPGSATDKRRQKEYSFGVMTIRDGDFTLEHVFYSDKG